MSQQLPVPPQDAIDLEAVWEQYPAVRQSVLAKYDDCPLSCLFDLRHGGGWSTHPQAGGTIFHRFAAEYLRTLQREKPPERQIPVAETFEILYEVVRQKDVPLHERVRVPTRDMPKLHIAVKKFCTDNRFSYEKIVDVERRLFAPIRYDRPEGGSVERTLTGQLDVLLFESRNEVPTAVVIDWKHTWQPPPERRGTGEEDRNADRRLSYEGYFQQRFYAYLVFMTYPSIQAVELREFYPLRGKVRKATITRQALEHVERELSMLIEAFDESIAAGTHRWIGEAAYEALPEPRPPIIKRNGGAVYVEVAGRQVYGDAWPALPGKHCGFCAKPGACPIEKESREDGAIETPEQAERYAAERQVAKRVYDHRTKALKAHIGTSGNPVPIKDSKGRRMVGWTLNPDGSRNFGEFVPDESDRGPRDPRLEHAMRESVEEARAMRDAARAARRQRKDAA